MISKCSRIVRYIDCTKRLVEVFLCSRNRPIRWSRGGDWEGIFFFLFGFVFLFVKKRHRITGDIIK